MRIKEAKKILGEEVISYWVVYVERMDGKMLSLSCWRVRIIGLS